MIAKTFRFENFGLGQHRSYRRWGVSRHPVSRQRLFFPAGVVEQKPWLVQYFDVKKQIKHNFWANANRSLFPDHTWDF